jgi:regulator of RNase E activity RraB
MSKEWDFYPLQIEGLPASIFLDTGIAGSAPLKSHPVMGHLRVRMRQPREDGLSSQAEAQELFALEDAVTAAIAQDSATLFVGRCTGGGTRDFIFYTGDGAVFETSASTAMGAFPGYQFSTGARPDPAWRVYFDFLYPSPEAWEGIKNRRVLHELAKHGDKPEKPRQIDHMAYFGSEADSRAFIAQILERRFTVRRGHPVTRDDGRVAVEFARTDRPAEIHAITLELVELIRAHRGEYDGWGCPVER